MDHKTLAQLGALLFVAIAALAAAVHWSIEGQDDGSSSYPTVHLLPPVPDPLRDGQRHCQQLGEAAAKDAVCLQIWSETRDRFLGRPAEGADGPTTVNGGR